MSLFRNWFRRDTPTATGPLVAARAGLDAFVVQTLAHVDRVALDRSRDRQHRALAYFFGAVEALAEAHGLDDTARLALDVQLLSGYFAANAAEIGSVTDLHARYEEDIELRTLRLEGGEAFTRWHGGRDPRATERLRELLALA